MKSILQRPERLLVVAVGCLLMGPLSKATWSQIRGPQLGYVFDESQGNLRAILGVPGASRLGDPLSLGVTLASAETSSEQGYALGITQDEGIPVVVAFGESAPSDAVQSLESIGLGASRIALSARGKSAAVLFPESLRLRILTGLPENPQVVGDIDLRPAGLPEALALDDEGKLVVLSVPENQGSRISLHSSETGFQSLGVFGDVSALTLSADRQVLVADRGSQEVILIRDILGAAQRIRIAGREDGIDDPVALEFSKDQKAVFVANARSGSVARLSLAGGPPNLTFCNCTPTALAKLDGDEVFRLTELSEKPLMMLEAGATETRVLFVPVSNALRGRAARERRASLPVETRRNRLP
jgi:hypothetical protein